MPRNFESRSRWQEPILVYRSWVTTGRQQTNRRQISGNGVASMENKARIVLVVSDNALSQTYTRQLSGYPVDIKVVASIRDLERALSGEAYNGIIIDLKTKLTAPRDQKELAYELLEHYPVLQSRIITDTGQIQAIPFGKARGDASLDTFLTALCQEFDARKVRSNLRKPVYFNVLLSKNGNFSDDDVERTFTVNISKGGCFIASTLSWTIGNSVAFIIKELTQTTPIVAEISWHVPWGKSMTIPGIGVRFEDIEAGQVQELIERHGL